MWKPVALLAGTYDRLADEDRLERLDHLFIWLAVAGLAIHLGLIGLVRASMLPMSLAAAIGESFLAALYTPFSFILFFEVLLMVLALPKSMTISLGKQYQIVSLIIIRSVFKDVAELDRLPSLGEDWSALQPILIDMGGGVALFALLGVFYHVGRRPLRKPGSHDPDSPHGRVIDEFIRQKKALATLLTMLLLVLAAIHLWQWSMSALDLVIYSVPMSMDVDQVFYVDLFTVMVFIDVLVLLLSMRLDNKYQMIFRNAGYMVATILLRMSLSVSNPLLSG